MNSVEKWIRARIADYGASLIAKTLYGSYDISDKNLKSLMKRAEGDYPKYLRIGRIEPNEKKQADEIRAELTHVTVTDKMRAEIDSFVISRKDKVWESITTANLIDKLRTVERAANSKRLRKILVFLASIICALCWYFASANETAILSGLRGYPLLANVSNLSNYFFWMVGSILGLGFSFLVIGLRFVIDDYLKISTARDEVDRGVVDALFFELRQAINIYIRKLSYEKTLDVTIAYGLEEGYDAAFEVDTPARKYAETLISKMTRGSIGIAGPRGTGKTTLLRASEGFRVNEREERIFIQISAPVVYDARDFILYLYSAICTTVIRKLDPFERGWRALKNQQGLSASMMSEFGLFFWAPFFLILFVGITSLRFLGDYLFSSKHVVIFETTIDVFPEGTFILAGVVIFILALFIAKGFSLFIPYFRLPTNKQPGDRRILSLAYSERRKIRYQQTLSSNTAGKFNLTVFEAGSDKGSSLQEYAQQFQI